MEKNNVGDQSSYSSHGGHVGPDIGRGKPGQAVEFERLNVQDGFITEHGSLIVHAASLAIKHGRRHEGQILGSKGASVEEAEAHDVR